MRLTFLLVLVIFLITSCSYQAIYDEQVLIDQSKWQKEQAARFEVAIDDTLSNFDFYINFRNTSNYRYSNLFVFLITKFPNGKVSRDTVECVLADETGRWLGKGWGDLKENDVLLKTELTFPVPGSYEFLVIQAMREDTLVGIRNVGLRIEHAN